MKKIFALSLLITLLAPAALAQLQSVSGTVLSAQTGEALKGATLKVKERNLATATDAGGRFSLPSLNAGETLLVSYVGYQSKEVVYQGGASLSILLEGQASRLQEVIINTGYQEIPKERATGSFTKIDTKLLNEQVSTSILERLESIANGLTVDRRSGISSIQIRGLSTIQGPKGPLIIVDNFPYEGDITNINPNDVESISLLKDAAAASIWGSRAGNGVIVITTKKGRFNQPLSIETNASITIAGAPDLNALELMSAAEFIEVEQFLFSKGYYTSQLAATNRPPLSPAVELLAKNAAGGLSAQGLQQGLDALRRSDIRSDLKKYVYRQPVNQQYAVALRGGSPNHAWTFSTGWDKNISELAATYQRLNLRLENTYKPFKNGEVSAGIYFTQTTSGGGRPGYSDLSTSNGNLPPYTRLADENGEPVAVLKNYRQPYLDTAGGGKLLNWSYYPLDDYRHVEKNNSVQDLLMNFGLRYRILPGLTLDLKYQYEKQSGEDRTLNTEDSYAARDLINRFTQLNRSTGVVTYKVPRGGILDMSAATLQSQKLRGQLLYNRSWSKGSISVVAGSEVSDVHSLSAGYRTYGYNDQILTSVPADPTATYPNFITGSGEYIPANTSFGDKRNRFVSFYGNGAYTFLNKYTLSLSGRRDASNLFGVKTNDQWTPLWSTGAAWELSKEKFYSASLFPYLRLRLTYGYSGNADLSRSAVTTISYLTNSPYTQGPQARPDRYANPNLRWEKSGMLNAGIDFKTKGERISGSLEYYQKKGEDLFGSVPNDYTTGIGGTVTKNIAQMKGNGLDVELTALTISRKAFQWVTGLNFNWNTDKVTRYYQSSQQGSSFVSGSTQTAISGLEGKPVYSIFSYRWAGLDPATGDPQGYAGGQLSKDYALLTGSGTQVTDLVYHGPAFPTFFGSLGNSFSYKGLSLSVRLLFKFHYYFRRQSVNYNSLFSTRTTHADYALRWQKPGDEAGTDVPSLIYPAVSRRDQFYTSSEVTVEKGDHVRVQYVTLSYDLTKGLLKKSGTLDAARLYVNINNVGILWRANKRGLDPDYRLPSFPPVSSIAIGFRTNF